MQNIYKTGEYLMNNPGWHINDSPWKALQIIKFITKHNLLPNKVCEIGCGSGEILEQLSAHLPNDTYFYGYEISPQAYEFCKKRKNKRIQFYLMDFFEDKNTFFDIILIIDVLEHIEDYYSFLRKLKNKGGIKIFHIPLDISVQSVFRKDAIMKWRQKYGHIHYFTKDLILATLKDAGYEIIDYFYAAGSLELPNRNIISRFFELPRKILFSLNKDFAVRLMGGFSLMILTK